MFGEYINSRLPANSIQVIVQKLCNDGTCGEVICALKESRN